MKTILALGLVALFMWSSPVSAEFCKKKSTGNAISCMYKIDRIEKKSQIIFSYTRQGWSMMIVVFLEEFQMIEGSAKVKPGRGTDTQSIEYVTTRRDMTPEGEMMEAPIYKVSEELLHVLGKAKGRVKFWLPGGLSRKDLEVKLTGSLFSDIEAYITETKSELGVLFQEQ
jgi:hypothetical protein